MSSDTTEKQAAVAPKTAARTKEKLKKPVTQAGKLLGEGAPISLTESQAARLKKSGHI
tara:strand:+ start:1608 stop:1781 length:174 start_codon:yes stop_codon:yes gene_type:complete